MKTKSKVKLVNISTWVMVVTISIVTVWFVGFLMANTFDLNIFAKRTSDFMFGFIGFSAVIIICAAILNISLNIGLIADKHVQEVSSNKPKIASKKTVGFAIVGLALMVVFMFSGDYLTRRSEKTKLLAAADYIVNKYGTSIAKIAPGLKDSARIGEVPEVLSFLSSQKSEFPSVSLLTYGDFDGQMTFLEISGWASKKTLKEPLYGNSFYKCEAYDCAYLQEFFTGKSNESLFWTEKNDYKLYHPFVKDGTRYLLLFTRYRSYGKIGS